MLKLEGVKDRCLHHLSGSALGNNGVTKVAIFGDSLSAFADMKIGMTTEASIGLQVPDMIGVFGISNFHAGKCIETIGFLDSGNSLSDLLLVLSIELRIVTLVKGSDHTVDIYESCILIGEGIFQCIHGNVLD